MQGFGKGEVGGVLDDEGSGGGEQASGAEVGQEGEGHGGFAQRFVVGGVEVDDVEGESF